MISCGLKRHTIRDKLLGKSSRMKNDYRYSASVFSELQLHVGCQTKTFSLNLAICDDPTLRDFLVHQLEVAYSEIQIIPFWPYTNDVFDHVRDNVPHGPHDSIFVSGLDDALSSEQPLKELYTNLNLSPGRWKAWFACPVIFWVSNDTADSLRSESKDFWEWLESIYRLDK